MKQKVNKVFSIIGNVFMYVFFAFSIILLIMTIVAKKNSDGAVSIMGYQMRIVISDSMAKNDDTYNDINKYSIKDIPVKSLLIIQNVPSDASEDWYEDIKVGDVLTFKYLINNRQETITHRVIDKVPNDDGIGYKIYLRGDNKSKTGEASVQIINTAAVNSPNYIIGKVVVKSFIVGLIIYAMRQPIGIALLVILPSIIIIIFEVVKIVNHYNEHKKAKLAEEKKEQLDEIEELKKKIAELSSDISKATEEKENKDNNESSDEA